MQIRFILFLGLALSLQGCTYAISPATTAKADRTITFQRLSSELRTNAGKTVILGGVIAVTRNLKNGTLLEIDQKELDYWGKPRRTSSSGGRFLVLHPSLLDPMVYAPGREVTVAGVVTAAEPKLGIPADAETLLLTTVEFKLWPRERSGWDKPTWMDPLHDPHSPEGKFSN